MSLPSAFAFANSPASTIPTRIRTDGAPAALPKTPKSSDTGNGTVVLTFFSPSPRFSAFSSRSVRPGSFTTTSETCFASTVTSGSFGAPAAVASAFAIRSMADSKCFWTSGLYERTVSSSFASSGMMFRFVPARNVPTVTTAGSSGLTSRETIVWSVTTVRAAMTIGSMVRCGIAPWPPFP
jgi:hypothetical protein